MRLKKDTKRYELNITLPSTYPFEIWDKEEKRIVNSSHEPELALAAIAILNLVEDASPQEE